MTTDKDPALALVRTLHDRVKARGEHVLAQVQAGAYSPDEGRGRFAEVTQLLVVLEEVVRDEAARLSVEAEQLQRDNERRGRQDPAIF